MLKRLKALLLISLVLPAFAIAEEYVANQHYQVIDIPVPTRGASKIEVVEVFWYGCPHCFRFEPMVQKWAESLAGDVDFRHSPAMWNDKMRIHAKILYTAEVLGILDKLHQPIFDALNVDHKKLLEEDEISQLFVANGVSKKDFTSAFNSFGVESKVKQADALARGYKTSGTPEIVVNGKYRISASSAGGNAEMLKIADYLINKERQSAKSK